MQIVRKMKTNDGDEIVAELEFDEERALRYLANKAWRNKTKRTKLSFIKVAVRPTQAALATRKKAALKALNEFVSEEEEPPIVV